MLDPATIVGYPLLLLLWVDAVSITLTADKTCPSMALLPPKMTSYQFCTMIAAH